MKMAAIKALAELAKEKVPEMVLKAYGGEKFAFSKEYIIPKPFDPRVLWYVAPAVAKAAIETGVAGITEMNWDDYKEELKERLGLSKEVIRIMLNKAQKNPGRIVYPEGEEESIIRAAHVVRRDNIAFPILLGDEKIIKQEIKRLDYGLDEFEIIDPITSNSTNNYAELFFNNRRRKGATLIDSKRLMIKTNYFGAMMVETSDADTMLSGLTSNYPNTIRPSLQCVGVKEGISVVSGLYIVVAKQDEFFFADTTVNVNPTAEQLVDITLSAADTVRDFDIEPRIAMLSFSNFGSAPHKESIKVKEAVSKIKSLRPDLMVDGEMQADTAIVPGIIEKEFSFSELKGRANVLIFPDLNSGR
jgi:malate dehydrogenase (oxaloacetate-decarboxylating)(NADP+)